MVQIRELEPLLCPGGQTSRIVWTSSSNARRSAFSIEDIQHRNGTEPYSSSKYASDMLSLALNRHKNSQVCLSHSPQITGTVVTISIHPHSKIQVLCKISQCHGSLAGRGVSSVNSCPIFLCLFRRFVIRRVKGRSKQLVGRGSVVCIKCRHFPFHCIVMLCLDKIAEYLAKVKSNTKNLIMVKFFVFDFTEHAHGFFNSLNVESPPQLWLHVFSQYAVDVFKVVIGHGRL